MNASSVPAELIQDRSVATIAAAHAARIVSPKESDVDAWGDDKGHVQDQRLADDRQRQHSDPTDASRHADQDRPYDRADHDSDDRGDGVVAEAVGRQPGEDRPGDRQRDRRGEPRQEQSNDVPPSGAQAFSRSLHGG